MIARLLAARNDAEAREQGIQTLFDRHIAPLVGRVMIAETKRAVISPAEAEDLESETLLRLLAKVRRVLADREAAPVGDLRDYVTATAHNVVEDHKRGRDPVRGRLNSRLRYVLTHSRHLAIWGRDPVLCGRVSWAGSPEAFPMAGLAAISADSAPDAVGLRETLEEIFRASGGPVALSDLVEAFARAEEPAPPVLVDQRDPASRLETRQYLEILWSEIVVLPVRQRQALLLHLRLGDGESVARVLPSLRVASVRQIAAALALPANDLAKLWKDLPLADERIVSIVGGTRQQIINLRKSARERLARRMARPR
ncbi:MAG: hypothetical protein ACRD16_01570 [Thermoanaerobaculia bacterium]